MTEKTGTISDALGLRFKALAVYRDLAMGPQSELSPQSDLARSLMAVSSTQQDSGNPDEALKSLVEAQRTLEKLLATRIEDKLQVLLGQTHLRTGIVLRDVGKLDEAIGSFGQALTIQERLVKAHPESIQRQADLARTLAVAGGHCVVAGKRAEGLGFLQRAVELRRQLADKHPELIELRADLSWCYDMLGYALQSNGESAAALEIFRERQAVLQRLVDENPNVTEFQFDLATCSNMIGWVLRQSGQAQTGLAEFEKAAVTLRKLADANPGVMRYQSRLAFTLNSIGGIQLESGGLAQGVAAIRESEAILQRLTALTAQDRYNLACKCALLARVATMPSSKMSAREAQAEADRAMTLLRGAVAAGYRNLDLMNRDHDLDSLRGRDDFKLLMMDLGFPADPFAR